MSNTSSERPGAEPAFPTVPPFPFSDGLRHGEPGLSFRDYAAVQFMAAFLSQSHAGPKDWTKMGHGWGEDCANDLNKRSDVTVMTLAGFAYRAADALLKARRDP